MSAHIDFSKVDAVITGAGPVGLATALQLRGSHLNVVVIEQREKYNRSQKVRVNGVSLEGLKQVDPDLAAKVSGWGGKRVSIQHIEETLSKKVAEYGIPILRPFKADPKALPELFPNAQFFIGADGARSPTRQHILGEEFAFDTTHQHIVHVEYEIEPDPSREQKTKNLSSSLCQYRRIKFAGYFISENRHNLPNGNVQVTLEIFVDPEIYNDMRKATFKEPYYFESDLDKVPPSLKKVLINWLGTEKGKVIQGERKNKMTVIKLSSCLAKQLYKVTPATATRARYVTVITGDAAAFSPFNTALNNGFLFSRALANSIKEAKRTQFVYTPMLGYAKKVAWIAQVEHIKSCIKSLFITLYHFWLRISNVVPWSTIKLSAKDAREAKDRGKLIWDSLCKPA